MVIMSSGAGMGDAALREWLPRLWRRIEDAHYSYLEIDDSPEKLQQKKKLEEYIMEYLSKAPHECKFRLSETSKVFHRTVNELPDFNAYRAGLGWAAIARYAANLLNQPWRKEYKVIRLYSGFFKHEVEANMVGAETLLHAMGYSPAGAGRLALLEPLCPDTVAAVSRDALVAHCECQIMVSIWEGVVSSGARITWRDVYRERTQSPRLSTHTQNSRTHGSEIYSNVPSTMPEGVSRVEARYTETEIVPEVRFPALSPPYAFPAESVPPYLYGVPHPDVPVVTQYVPYYYPVPTPYMVPTPVYPGVERPAPAPLNGYGAPWRGTAPPVPTAQLIELEPPAPYEDRRRRAATPPSLPRSDTQPALSKAREDGMGTYESWDYVFRNLSDKGAGGLGAPSPSGYSPSDRDSRTLDRVERAPRARALPATLDLEDGLHALALDHRLDDSDKNSKKTRQIVKKIQAEERRTRRSVEPVANPKADALLVRKVAPDKVKLLSKKDIKDRKDIIKQQNSANGAVSDPAEVKKVRKPTKLVASEVEPVRSRPVENGTHGSHNSKTGSSSSSQNYDLKAQLIVSLDETDSVRRSPPRPIAQQNGDRPTSRNSSHGAQVRCERWECGTCTYLNKGGNAACEMCGKSKRGPEIQPLTSGGRECPACTLVNHREARLCDACGTNLDRCPTYI